MVEIPFTQDDIDFLGVSLVALQRYIEVEQREGWEVSHYRLETMINYLAMCATCAELDLVMFRIGENMMEGGVLDEQED